LSRHRTIGAEIKIPAGIVANKWGKKEWGIFVLLRSQIDALRVIECRLAGDRIWEGREYWS
jgi:hypothetical protein